MTFIDGGTTTPLYLIGAEPGYAYAMLGTWAIAAVAPLSGDRTPMLQPDLQALVNAAVPPMSVEWQLAANWGFSPLLFTSTDAGVGNGPTLKIVSSALTNGSTYYWRARSGDGAGVWGAWSEVQSFTVDLNQGRGYGEIYINNGNNTDTDREDYASGAIFINQGVTTGTVSSDTLYTYINLGFVPFDGLSWAEQMYWGDVSDNTPTPHIWWLKPNAGRSGDGIQIVCFGVGDLQSTFNGVVEIYKGIADGWEAVPINSWQAYPATVNAYTELRTMDEWENYTDMQHQVVEITVPAGAIPPGYPLRLKTTGP